MEIPNELGLYSETAGYCCSSIPGMVKDFKQCVATPKLEKHHQAFYFCKEGALKDNKCYETTYSCSEGYNLVGDKCILPEATCPDGYALDSSKSTSTSYVCSKINYYCENNDKHILSGDKCLCKTNGKIYTIWVEDQETSKQQHEIQWLKSIKRTITTNSQAEVDVISTAQVNHETCNIDSATNTLNCSHIVSGPIGTLGPDLMNLSKKANGVYTYLNAESEDGSGYYTDVNWKKFNVSINNKIYPVSGIYSQCAETAVIADNGDIYQVKCGKAQTCSEINSSYVGAKASCSDCGNPYYTLEDVPNVFGSDGQCKKCLLDKCNDIDSDWIGPNESCEFGYRKTKLEARDYGSDGQCYECTEAFTNVIVHLERGYVEGSYEDGEGVIGSQYSNWSAYLEITDPEVAQIDEKTYTLPFEMKIETMYSTFSFDSDNRPRCESYACSYQWAKITIPAGTKAIPRTPQTIKVRGYGGENLLREMEKMYNVEYFKVDYTINGKLQKDLYDHDAHIHFGFYEEDY